MARRHTWLGLVALLAIDGCDDAAALAKAVPRPESQVAMSDDVRRMHDRLIASSKGEGSVSDLRIEFMDGGMASHRSFSVEGGKLVSKEWTSPGSPMIHREGSVTRARISKLLQQLIAKQYWTFEGTRFVPDAPLFLFRFHYGELKPVDFRCDAEELKESDTRRAIRDLFLEFASETEMTTVPVRKSSGAEAAERRAPLATAHERQ